MSLADRAAKASAAPAWTPPVIYDQATDTWRAVTQADVDRLLALAYQLSTLRRALRTALDVSAPVDA